jgi:hypothetical protein
MRRGPSPVILAKIQAVRLHLENGEKLTWALAIADISSQSWYRWAGWKKTGPYRRSVYVCRPVVERLMTAAELLIAEGERASVACRKVGLSYDTYWARKKRKSAA